MLNLIKDLESAIKSNNLFKFLKILEAENIDFNFYYFQKYWILYIYFKESIITYRQNEKIIRIEYAID